jgi:hypothetical protein
MFRLERLLEVAGVHVRKLEWILGPYLYGTAINTVVRLLDRQGRSLLDVGGGQGEPMAILNKKHSFRLTVNADVHLTQLEESQKMGTHDQHVLCGGQRLPFQRKSFDIVLCLETIEHLEKEDGFSLLSNLEEIARKQVILSMPVGEKIPSEGRDPPWRHSSSWYPADLRKLGYEVRGKGFPNIKGCLLVASPNKFLSLLGCLLYPVASPFVYFFPDKAGGMVGIKYLDKNSPGSGENEN